MCTKKKTNPSTGNFSELIDRLARDIREADAVVVGAGAGLSASAGFTYSGSRFEKNFADFIQKYGFRDMYTAGFYPYPTLEEYWAYWSRYISINRYGQPAGTPYRDLFELLKEKNYFILTTNVDHQFQIAGFDKKRLYYMQGDFGLWQCSRPCHQKTYDNEAAVRRMVSEQRDMRIPTELVPRCPVCGAPMCMNLRVDDTFVEDEGWHEALGRYQEYLAAHETSAVLYLELGVGGNTPGIIRYVFPELTRRNPRAHFARINLLQAGAPREIADRSISLQCDCKQALAETLLRLPG